jgi:hypothetical protein
MIVRMKVRVMNKKAMSISIILLVILTLILVTVNITYFLLRERNIQKTINMPAELEALHIKEAQINYRLQNIFDRATEDFKAKQGKGVFIKDFKKESERYRTEVPLVDIMDQVDRQLAVENIKITNQSLIFELDITLNMAKWVDEKLVFDVEYTYTKKFEKVFKVKSA